MAKMGRKSPWELALEDPHLMRLGDFLATQMGKVALARLELELELEWSGGGQEEEEVRQGRHQARHPAQGVQQHEAGAGVQCAAVLLPDLLHRPDGRQLPQVHGLPARVL